MINADKLNYYLFTNKKLVSQAVRNISEIIARENIVSNVDDYEEFLTTVIGEVFVNSMMHSQQKEILLIFDVTYEENSCYLDVLILDYGKTIQENVQMYFDEKIYKNNEWYDENHFRRCTLYADTWKRENRLSRRLLAWDKCYISHKTAGYRACYSI